MICTTILHTAHSLVPKSTLFSSDRPVDSSIQLVCWRRIMKVTHHEFEVWKGKLQPTINEKLIAFPTAMGSVLLTPRLSIQLEYLATGSKILACRSPSDLEKIEMVSVEVFSSPRDKKWEGVGAIRGKKLIHWFCFRWQNIDFNVPPIVSKKKNARFFKNDHDKNMHVPKGNVKMLECYFRFFLCRRRLTARFQIIEILWEFLKDILWSEVDTNKTSI